MSRREIRYKIRKWCWDAENECYDVEIELFAEQEKEAAEARFASIPITDDLPQIELVWERIACGCVIEEKRLAFRDEQEGGRNDL